MARKRTDTTEQAESTQRSNGGERPTKYDAVRLALKELGRDAKPKQIGEFTRERFGLELSNNLINNYKHHLLKKGKGKAVKAKRVQKANGGQKKVVAGGNGRGGISVEDIEAVKQLTERIGAESLKELVDVLAR